MSCDVNIRFLNKAFTVQAFLLAHQSCDEFDCCNLIGSFYLSIIAPRVCRPVPIHLYWNEPNSTGVVVVITGKLIAYLCNISE